jgi:hypothetical protein
VPKHADLGWPAARRVLLRKRCEGLAAIAPPNRVKKSRRFIAAPKLRSPGLGKPFELNERGGAPLSHLGVPLARIPDRFSSMA